jgi:hypothetical protein
MRQILPNVYQWSVWNEEKGLTFNGHLLRTEEGIIVIDPPPIDPQILRTIGIPGFIYLTNKDHVRDTRTFEQVFKSAVMIHDYDNTVDIAITGTFMNNDILPGGCKIIHLRDQKTAGESAILWQDILILGDALISREIGRLIQLPSEKFIDQQKAKNALSSLLELEFKHLLLGDGHCILDNGKSLLAQYLNGKR